MEQLYEAHYWFSRFLLHRSIGGIYLVAFLVALNQFRPLLGENGLLPATRFLNHTGFRKAPGIFHWHYSDRFFSAVTCTGILLSIMAFTGFSDAGPLWLSMLVWFLLWALYLSIVNVGQVFYGFGWESLLLEAGFYAIFLGPFHMAEPVIVIWLFRWTLFRVEFGAGLIKMRGDRCWRDLTCLYYHHETQPMPNPMSWFFHRIPQRVHRFETLFNHFVQLIVIWAIFLPQPVAAIAACIIVLSQAYLIISGNYAWLNWLTLFMAFSCFNDRIIKTVTGLNAPSVMPVPINLEAIIILLTVTVILMSIQPVRNMISSRQIMNFSFNPLHLVNTYGAFGNVTRQRYEIILEGTDDDPDSDKAVWKPYEFKGKPGNTSRFPAQIAPYHLRLDWQMWFAAMTTHHQHPWFPVMLKKMLEGDEAFLKLLKTNPFPDKPPKYIRPRLFLYRYTSNEVRRETGEWWQRRYIQSYIRPLSLDDFNE